MTRPKLKTSGERFFKALTHQSNGDYTMEKIESERERIKAGRTHLRSWIVKLRDATTPREHEYAFQMVLRLTGFRNSTR